MMGGGGSEQEEATTTTSSATAHHAVSSVLTNCDLLGEILLRLASPGDLVRAALACRRWLRAASDPVLLRRFRDLHHPPRLLGFYTNTDHLMGLGQRAEFWPLQHLPQWLADAVRRAASALDAAFPGSVPRVLDCRGGRLLVDVAGYGFPNQGALVICPLGVGNPTATADGAVVLPPSPPLALERPILRRSRKILPEHAGGGGGVVQCFDLVVAHRHGEPHRTIQVSEFRDGAWAVRASLKTELLQSALLPKVLLAHGKFYMTTRENILVLDLASSSFSVVDFPEKVDVDFNGGRLAKAEDYSGIYLINLVRGEKLRVWLHKAPSGGSTVGKWILVRTIHVRKVFAKRKISATGFTVSCVGDNGMFVLLEVESGAFCMRVHSRAVEPVVMKMSEGSRYNEFDRRAWPFTIWPPSFPRAMQGRHHQDE